MMSDEELDLFIEGMKKELEADSSKPVNVCPCCEQLLSEAAAEHIGQFSQSAQADS